VSSFNTTNSGNTCKSVDVSVSYWRLVSAHEYAACRVSSIKGEVRDDILIQELLKSESTLAEARDAKRFR
jgi:hypothetical protein